MLYAEKQPHIMRFPPPNFGVGMAFLRPGICIYVLTSFHVWIVWVVTDI